MCGVTLSLLCVCMCVCLQRKKELIELGMSVCGDDMLPGEMTCIALHSSCFSLLHFLCLDSSVLALGADACMCSSLFVYM